MDKDVLHKEIDLIQGVITRMATNSFYLKGWMISLIAVILALTKETIVASEVSYFNFTLCLPVLVFWYLDAFFLHKEKCYRKLYDWVIQNRKNTDEHLYSLNYARFEKQVEGIFMIMLSKTLLPFYGLTLVILIVIQIFNIS
jgi:hypothetical protein